PSLSSNSWPFPPPHWRGTRAASPEPLSFATAVRDERLRNHLSNPGRSARAVFHLPDGDEFQDLALAPRAHDVCRFLRGGDLHGLCRPGDEDPSGLGRIARKIQRELRKGSQEC